MPVSCEDDKYSEILYIDYCIEAEYDAASMKPKFVYGQAFNLFTETWIVNHISTFSGVAHYGCVIYTDGRDCLMGKTTCGFIPCFIADEYAEEVKQ